MLVVTMAYLVGVIIYVLAKGYEVDLQLKFMHQEFHKYIFYVTISIILAICLFFLPFTMILSGVH